MKHLTHHTSGGTNRVNGIGNQPELGMKQRNTQILQTAVLEAAAQFDDVFCGHRE